MPGGWLLIREPGFHLTCKDPCRERGALYFQLFFAEVYDRVIAAGQLDAPSIDAASTLLDDPNYCTQCWMMTAAWVRKPLRDAPFGAPSKWS